MPMDAVYAGLALLMGLIFAAMSFENWPLQRRVLLGAIIAATVFGLMLLMDRKLGVAAGWNVFALMFIGGSAWQAQRVYEKTFFREAQPWDGHKPQNPETEEFSDGLLLTTHALTGAMHGVVLSGAFRRRELGDLSGAELDELAAGLAQRDQHGIALLTKYRNWKQSASP